MKEIKEYIVTQKTNDYLDRVITIGTFDSEEDAQGVRQALKGASRLFAEFTDGTWERLDKPMDKIFNVHYKKGEKL